MAKAKRRYWLMKSEEDVYSIRDLEQDGSTTWEGVRNYQARNYMRDDMKVGDGVFFYHSNAKPAGVAGIAKISKEAYPDPFQFKKGHKYHDPKSKKEDPAWLMVEIEFVSKLDEVLSLADLKANPKLNDMPVVQRFQRLSVQPVSESEWKEVCKMAGVSPKL